MTKALLIALLVPFSALAEAPSAPTATLDIQGSRYANPHVREIKVLNILNRGTSGTLLCQLYGYDGSWYAHNMRMFDYNSIRIDQTGQELVFANTKQCRQAEAYVSDSRMKTTITYSPKTGKVLEVTATAAGDAR